MLRRENIDSRMSDIAEIHKSRQPRRPHYIPQWAEARQLTQADLARELGADKSVVSRWFSGTTPGLDWQERLAALFHIDREALFRHPDDDWFAKFFKDREREEIERMKRVLEDAFPRRRSA
jgi:transcriptional regulator with XRE-family HTH domain